MLTATLLTCLVLAPETRMTPFATWSGANSKIHKAETMLLKSQSDWDNAWRRNKGWTDATKKAPALDFKRWWVVGVIRGDEHLCRGYVTSPAPYGIFDSADKMILKIKPNWRYTTEREEETNPYLFIAIKRNPGKPIVIMHDDARENGEAPIWRKLTTLNQKTPSIPSR
ncbi:MAG: hypothetical protein IT206_05395 [Fimbriimonadaceae bacterium]|nr:hypothetical protein [Fimbriimonadaceae bacterium]